MQEVVALLHQHLAQAVLQDLDRPADASVDHRRECGVEDCVGRHELAPLGPWLVEVGKVAQAGRVRFALGTSRVGPQRFEAAVEDAAVAEVVETHRRGRDVGLERRRPCGPLGVAQAEHLLVVGDRQDEVGKAQASPGDHRRITSSLRTIAISHQRSSSYVARAYAIARSASGATTLPTRCKGSIRALRANTSYSTAATPSKPGAWPFERQHLQAHQRRRSEEHTSELQSQSNLVCRLLLEKKKKT